MITFVVSLRHRHHLLMYLESWAGDLRDRIRIVDYPELATGHPLSHGTIVFCDHEAFSPPEKAFAIESWEKLSRTGCFRLVNDPSRALSRTELMIELADLGLNDFRVHRVSGIDSTRVHFPAFVRVRDDHKGNLTDLVHDRNSLDREIAGLEKQHDPARLIVIEYCETRLPGDVYRKYSIFRVGDRYVPHHLVFSRRWNLKMHDIIDDARAEEERIFLESNPHASWVRDVFEISRIEFGRLEYAISGERPQAWEINTNPMIMLAPRSYPRTLMPMRQAFAVEIGKALEEIDSPDDGAQTQLDYSSEVRAAMAEIADAQKAEMRALQHAAERERWRRWSRGAIRLVRAALTRGTE